MSTGDLVLHLSQFAFQAIATFLAIILWSRTRDSAWMLIVIGTVASYADILYNSLRSFGMLDEAAFSVAGIPVARLVFANLPSLFYILGFAVMIARKRLR
jgi:hypothetical protein